MIEMNMNSYHWWRIRIHIIDEGYEFVWSRGAMKDMNSYVSIEVWIHNIWVHTWCKERRERLTLDSTDAVGSRVGPTLLGTGGCNFAEFVTLFTSSGGGCSMEEWEVEQVPEINEERSRWLSAIAECVADSEGRRFLATMMDVWIQWRWGRRRWLFGVQQRYEVMWLAHRWWWQMVCGDVALMRQQVRTHKRTVGENETSTTEY